MTDINLDKLRRMAEAATPGPWDITGNGDWKREVRGPDWNVAWCGHMSTLRAHADATYIAAVNPATVIALLDRLERAEAKRDAAYRALAASMEDAEEDCDCDVCATHATAIAAARAFVWSKEND